MNDNLLTIVQYNVQNSDKKVQRPFLRDLDSRKHHIIAIQEPWTNPRSRCTVSDPRYHLALPMRTTPRTCMYISKELPTDKWTFTEHSGHLTTLALQVENTTIHVHNCYNPPSTLHSSTELGTLSLLKEVLAKEGQHILLGDFNLHHPLVGRTGYATATQSCGPPSRMHTRGRTPPPSSSGNDHERGTQQRLYPRPRFRYEMD